MHEWRKYVGSADFEYYNDNLHLANYQLIPVNFNEAEEKGTSAITNGIIENSQMLALLEPYQKQGETILNEVIGCTEQKLEGERKIVRNQINPLGVLIATAISSGPVKADFGILNSGGIRASIAQGPIEYRDVLSVQPFENSISKVTMRGIEVKNILAW